MQTCWLLVTGFNIVLFTSTQLQILRGRVLSNDFSHRHSSSESTCVNPRYGSRLDHFLVTRSKEFTTNDSGNRDSSNRGVTSTATKTNVKQEMKKGFTLQQCGWEKSCCVLTCCTRLYRVSRPCGTEFESPLCRRNRRCSISDGGRSTLELSSSSLWVFDSFRPGIAKMCFVYGWS